MALCAGCVVCAARALAGVQCAAPSPLPDPSFTRRLALRAVCRHRRLWRRGLPHRCVLPTAAAAVAAVCCLLLLLLPPPSLLLLLLLLLLARVCVRLCTCVCALVRPREGGREVVTGMEVVRREGDREGGREVVRREGGRS